MSLPNVWVRILVGVALVPVILLVAWAGGAYLTLFVDMVIVIGLWEFYRLCQAKGIEPNRYLGISGGVAISIAATIHAEHAIPGVVAIVVIASASFEVFRNRSSSAIQNVAATVFGVLYVGWLTSHLILLRHINEGADNLTEMDGMGAVLLALFIPWICDTAAYFTGRAIGRHKLIPRVSAGKTVEGAIGGLVGTPLILLMLRPELFAFIGTVDTVILGLAGAVVSQTGDLAESLIKRDANVKDASHIIPGHGGVLDRFDSVLFSAPFVFYYLTVVAL
jgi:phosphatidate cytidylyltransferase